MLIHFQILHDDKFSLKIDTSETVSKLKQKIEGFKVWDQTMYQFV